jgi:pyrroline-5-carboxylate reductase
MNTKIAIIGTGNLGSSIARGLVKNNFPAENITATRRKVEQLISLSRIGIHTTDDNCEAVKRADIVILAVKPFKIETILDEIAPCLRNEHILVSAVSGISIETIKKTHQQPGNQHLPNNAKHCHCY